MLLTAVFLYFVSVAVAQSSRSLSVVCIAGQCLQGFSNTTIGATLSTSGASNGYSIHLLPGTYTTSTNPQLLHDSLTAHSPSLAPSPGFENATLVSTLPLTLALSPGLAIYSDINFSGQAAFSSIPSTRNLQSNSSTPLPARSLALPSTVWASISDSQNSRFVIWDAVPDVSQLPLGLSSLSLLDMQSSSCSPSCSAFGVCTASGTCACPPGFAGISCESCAPGLFGPTCQACPSGCKQCDDGLAGSGRCLVQEVQECGCENGVCGSDGTCVCNVGWTTGDDGTKCSKCQSGLFLSSTGDCKVCQIGCTECAETTGACISCKSGFTKDPNNPTKCNAIPSKSSSGTSCPDRSFSSNGVCTVCDPSCQSCSGSTSNDCIICAQGSFLFNGSCVQADPKGICEGTNGMVADNSKRECDTCGAKCTSCEIPNFNVGSTVNDLQCTNCLPGFVLSKGTCVESCPAGTFVNPQDNLTCMPCDSSCTTCETSSTFCLSCPASQLADPNGKCVNACPPSTFPSAANSSSSSSPTQCASCHPDCSSCSGPSFNQCTACPASRPALVSGRCLPTCARGEYIDTQTNACTQCNAECATCAGPDAEMCLSCADGQVLRKGSCVNASCKNNGVVVPGLGICLTDLVDVPTPNTTSTSSPLPSLTGLSDPTVQDAPSTRMLAWWEILLMALGCAFVFICALLCWRRRAKKRREEATREFAAKRGLSRIGWRERLGRVFRRRKGRVNLGNSDRNLARGVYRDEEEGEGPMRVRESTLDMDKFVDAYQYPRSSKSLRSKPSLGRAPSTPSSHSSYHRRKQEADRASVNTHTSMYSTLVGVPRSGPEPRQPVGKEVIKSSNAAGRSLTLVGETSLNQKNETPLVDIGQGSEKQSAILQPRILTDAERYALAVWPNLLSRGTITGVSSEERGHLTQPASGGLTIHPMHTGDSYTSNNPFRRNFSAT